MELLDPEGTDLLKRGIPKAVATEVSHRSSPAQVSVSGFAPRFERVVLVIAVLASLAAVYLFFRELPLTGLTWDEWMDFDIARDYHQNQSFLTNHDDPSQARFSHIVAAGSFALFGESYFTFKLPFVVAGLLGGVWLWVFLSRLVRPAVAALAAAMYFTCPYVLAASRTGATAGDALVMVTALGFIISLHDWVRTQRFWPHGLVCGIMCGLGAGAKWTSSLLLVGAALVWFAYLVSRRRRVFEPTVWTGVLAQQWVSVALMVLACPTLLLGLPFVRDSLSHSLKFTGMVMRQFGEMRSTAPHYYVPAVLIAKFSIAQLCVAILEVVLAMFLWSSRHKKPGILHFACLASLLPAVALAQKGFQNAHYYVISVPAVMMLSAVALDRWVRSGKPLVQYASLGIALLVLFGQIGTSVYLAPDYLMAGRQFGELFYSQFSGPVVNHCQGMPLAIREINRLVSEENGPHSAYILRSCMGVMTHALEAGPVKALVPIEPYPATGAHTEHFLLVPRSYDYDLVGEHEARVFGELKAQLTTDCDLVGKRSSDFDLWICPPRT
jgi:hypothetical protein